MQTRFRSGKERISLRVTSLRGFQLSAQTIMSIFIAFSIRANVTNLGWRPCSDRGHCSRIFCNEGTSWSIYVWLPRGLVLATFLTMVKQIIPWCAWSWRAEQNAWLVRRSICRSCMHLCVLFRPWLRTDTLPRKDSCKTSWTWDIP